VKSESEVQADVRLRAPLVRAHLFRNNSGVLPNEAGRPVRYGLANESAAVNRVLKSADLIGWQSVTVTADMVGQTLAVFLSVEVKPEDFNGPSGKAEAERYEAQKNWANLVNKAGGRAYIVTDARQIT
jgi:hypothetical protein